MVRFLKWSGGLLAVLLLAAFVIEGFKGAFCLMMLLIFLAIGGSPFIFAIYLLYRLARRLGGINVIVVDPAAAAGGPASARRTGNSGNAAALLSYIDDALRMGQDAERIKSDLLNKGWLLGQVESAFGRYSEIMGGRSAAPGGA